MCLWVLLLLLRLELLLLNNNNNNNNILDWYGFIGFEWGLLVLMEKEQ